MTYIFSFLFLAKNNNFHMEHVYTFFKTNCLVVSAYFQSLVNACMSPWVCLFDNFNQRMTEVLVAIFDGYDAYLIEIYDAINNIPSILKEVAHIRRGKKKKEECILQQSVFHLHLLDDCKKFVWTV